MLEYFLAVGGAQPTQGLAYLPAEFLAVNNIGQSQLLRSEGQEQKKRKLGKENGMRTRGWQMGCMRMPLMTLWWILLKGQMMSVGALLEVIPALQELEHALVTIPDPTGEKNNEGYRMGDAPGKERKQPEKGPKKLSSKQPGKGTQYPRKKQPEGNPRTIKEPVERWSSKKSTGKEAEEKEEEGEVQKKKLVEEVQRKDGTSPCGREERRGERKGRPKDGQASKSETSLGKVWKMALSLNAVGAELVVCQRCSGRIAEKNGDDGKNAAARSPSERKQMGGGDPAKMEAAKRRKARSWLHKETRAAKRARTSFADSAVELPRRPGSVSTPAACSIAFCQRELSRLAARLESEALSRPILFLTAARCWFHQLQTLCHRDHEQS